MSQVRYCRRLNFCSFGKQLFHSAFHPLTTDICISSIYRPRRRLWRKEEPRHFEQVQELMLGSSLLHHWLLMMSAGSSWLAALSWWQQGPQRCWSHLLFSMKFHLFSKKLTLVASSGLRGIAFHLPCIKVKFVGFGFFFNLKVKVHETA